MHIGYLVPHGGVGTFAKEKDLELKRINSVKKRRQKEVTVSDRTLALAGLACPVGGSSWAHSRSSDRTLHSKSDLRVTTSKRTDDNLKACLNGD